MNNAMSNYFNNLYLLTAILVSMIIHLILLIITDLTLNHQVYLAPPSDIEISFINKIPNNNINRRLIASPNKSIQEEKITGPKVKKQIKNNAKSVKVSPVINEIKNNAKSVKVAPSIKKITAIDTNQILSNIKQSIPIAIEGINKKIRSKKISSSTVDYEYRLYFEAWRQKVERIGALNYPEAAKSAIFQALRLTVSLSQTGNIEDIVINKSSGNPALDEAAILIVKMGEPYAKFSNRMRNEVDLIRITRTWKFTEGNKFSSQ
jgi:TonB family protein|tara:strand:+ start:1657 stop:2445 length:789 start_codon:yes stop_codon:yes gene_type:complete